MTGRYRRTSRPRRRGR